MSKVASSEVRPRKSASEELADFRRSLQELHNRAGRPTKTVMSKKAGRPTFVFGFLDIAELFPTWDEVSTFLVAMEQPSPVVERYRRSHQRLKTRLDGAHADTSARPGLVPGSAESVVFNLDTAELRALADAKAARTATAFGAALDRLRSTARLRGKEEPLSYKDMEKVSGKRLGKSTAQRLATMTELPSKSTKIVEFVRACGMSEDQVRLWTDEYLRLRRGDPPTLSQHEVLASSSDQAARSDTAPAGLLAGLTDTDSFTTDRLGLDGRKLILFVSAAIVDDTGSAETTYRSLLRRRGSSPYHWAQGMTLDQLDNHLAQYLGRTARKMPFWPMIADLLDAAIRDPKDREQVLADAAGLYNQVADEPPPGYAGSMHLPWWGYPITGRTQLETVLASLPQAGRKLTDTELEVIELREEKFRYRQALDTAIRGFRALADREAGVAARERALDTYNKRLQDKEKQLAEREELLRVHEALMRSPGAESLPGPEEWHLREASGS